MKHLAPRPGSTKGFTLLEALIALVVVAVGLLALAQLHGTALLYTADARTRTQATKLAQAKLDNLKTFYTRNTFNALKSAPADETAATPGSDLAAPGLDRSERFRLSWTVAGEYIRSYFCDTDLSPSNVSLVEIPCAIPPCPCPDATCDDLADLQTSNCHQKRIHTDVEWTDAHGAPQKIGLETIIESFNPFVAGSILIPTSIPSP
jgi:prepilin-type N-terminal cleavage/methylation domain-containing protein